jgi:hypothetical protein
MNTNMFSVPQQVLTASTPKQSELGPKKEAVPRKDSPIIPYCKMLADTAMKLDAKIQVMQQI